MILSIISPIFHGEKMLDELVQRIESSVIHITNEYEVILVNDASPDNSWKKIQEICQTDEKVKGVNLSRNFGQHYAITAGLSVSSGDYVVVMDCDLQDRPEEIPNLYKKIQEGYDTVFAEWQERHDKFMKKFTSRAFNHFFAYFTDSPVERKTANFGIYKREVINAVLTMGDYIRCFPIMVRWVGFNVGYLPMVKDERAEGKSSYTWSKLFAFAFNNIVAFSNKPLRLTLRFGFYIVLLSIIVMLYYVIMYFVGGIQVSGFTTLVLSLWLIGGIIIMILGMLGIYIGKIFDEAKNRPTFIIREKINF